MDIPSEELLVQSFLRGRVLVRHNGAQTLGMVKETLDNKTQRPPNRLNLFAPNYSV